MRLIYSIVMLCVFPLLLLSNNTTPQTSLTKHNTRISYVCPMHPAITSDHKENCSKCGMFLIKQEKHNKTTHETYSCPMHPAITSDHKENCSICGMFLVKQKKSHANVHENHDYSCPMHPSITSDHKENCSICGMYLKKKKSSKKNTAYYVCPLHPLEVTDHKGKCSLCGTHLKETQAPIISKGYYVCPMHPKIMSNKKGKCSICGMHLQKKEVSIRTSSESRHKCERPVPSMADINEMKRQEIQADIDYAKRVGPQKSPYLALQYKRKTADGSQYQNSTIEKEKKKTKEVEKLSSKPKSNPYLALQYKKKTTDHDEHQHMTHNAENKPVSPVQPSHHPMPKAVETSVSTTDSADIYACPMHPTIVSKSKDNCPICGMFLVKQKKQSVPQDEKYILTLPAGVIQKIGVKTSSVTRGVLRKSLKTVGTIDYNRDRLIDLTSRTDGWVENLSVRREGLMVRRGQLLMEMYSPQYLQTQKEFLDAQKKDHSAGQLKRYEQRDETVHSRETLRYLKVPESAINELVRKGKTRHRIPVYAPQHGKIVRLNVKNHSYVYEGDVMLTIADLSSVWVEVHIFQYQLEWLRRNQEAEIVVDVLPGERLKGRVDAIDPELDPRTHTVKVRILVANPDRILLPNMFTQVTIFDNAEQDLLKIPREALITTGDQTRVIKAMGKGRFVPVNVVAGLHNGGEVEIISGLSEGDQVVTSGQFLIDSEANLRASFRRFEQPDEMTHHDGKK